VEPVLVAAKKHPLAKGGELQKLGLANQRGQWLALRAPRGAHPSLFILNARAILAVTPETPAQSKRLYH